MLYLRWLRCRPRRSWWLLDDQGLLVWDFWTHRAARRAADTLNARQVTMGTTRRFTVQRMP